MDQSGCAVLFLALAAEGRLTGPFPYSAAWGDIITGVVAVPVLWLLKDDAAFIRGHFPTAESR